MSRNWNEPIPAITDLKPEIRPPAESSEPDPGARGAEEARTSEEYDDLDTEESEWEEDDAAEASEGEPPARRLEQRLPMVAIVGRPNVGKSTLFNRLVGDRRALVHDRPGMTRDRRIERVEWDGVPFLLVDTGGFDVELEDPLLENVAEQARVAMQEADLILMLTAVGEERHPAEDEMVRILRRASKPVVVAVNKCDSPKQDLQAGDYYQYGFDEIYPVSALHGRGTGDMVTSILKKLESIPAPVRSVPSDPGIRVAIVGRQNVGKSTLINQLLGETRVIASDLPGTTRDAIDTLFETPEGDVFTLIDTAGIRRRGKVEVGVEKISVLSSMIAIRRADVTVIVIDATQGLTAQDGHIAGYCVNEGCACILLMNKWDKVEKESKTAARMTKKLQDEWSFLSHAPVMVGSALTGEKIHRLLGLVKEVHLNAGRKIATPRFNRLLEEWTTRNPPPIRANRRPKIKYGAQIASHPPTFKLFVNDPKLFHFSYRRFLINRIRETEDFTGSPIRLILSSKGNTKGPAETA